MVDWHPFDYENKKKRPLPPAYEIVWVVEEFYHAGVTLGYFDGFTWRIVADGSDDCKVSFWADLEYPNQPEGWLAGE